MNILLGILHGFDYLFTLLLVGSVVFYQLILPAGGELAQHLIPHWKTKIRTLLGLVFFSSLLWMLFSSADMADSWSLTELWTAMSQTSFGHLWCIRILLLLVLFFISRIMFRNRSLALVFSTLILLIPIFSSFTGHAASQEKSYIFRVSVDWLHILAVSVWSGGLLSLYGWLSVRLASEQNELGASYKVVQRFSHFAMVSTAIIFGTGVVMAYLNGFSIFHPLANAYGKLLFAKILVFFVALGTAGINQFIHLKKWDSKNENQFVVNIRREVRFEIMMVLIIVLLTGYLTRTALPMEMN